MTVYLTGYSDSLIVWPVSVNYIHHLVLDKYVTPVSKMSSQITVFSYFKWVGLGVSIAKFRIKIEHEAYGNGNLNLHQRNGNNCDLESELNQNRNILN